jgi:hypothetical protein
MKRLAWLLLLSVVTIRPASAQASKMLEVTLRSRSSLCKINDNLELEIIRENVGSHDLVVPRSLAWGGGRTNIWVYDDKGKEVVTTYLADELPPPPQPWDFVVLDRGDFVGTRVKEPVTHFIKKPGEYELVVDYRSYLSEHYAPEVMTKMPSAVFWTSERGPLRSNRIKLTVTK